LNDVKSSLQRPMDLNNKRRSSHASLTERSPERIVELAHTHTERIGVPMNIAVGIGKETWMTLTLAE